jgi:uncharacterized membrane protein (UPF0127 family)
MFLSISKIFSMKSKNLSLSLKRGFPFYVNLIILGAVYFGIYSWIFPKSQAIPTKPISLPLDAQVQFGDQSILLERALTTTQISTGLMFRDALPLNQGMFFPVHYKPAYLWAKNVKIPLDVLFLDSTNKIITISSLQPCLDKQDCPKLTVPKSTESVIELNAGTAQRIGVKTGSILSIKLK